MNPLIETIVDCCPAKIRSIPWLIIAALRSLWVLAVLFCGCQSETAPEVTTDSIDPVQPVVTKPAPVATDYVGSQTCAECHAEIADRYAGHPMASSAWRVAQAPTVEDDSSASFQAPGRYRYKVERDAEQVTHVQQKLDRDGNVISELEEPVEYVVGSGQRGRSYFIRRGDVLFQSPITWYSHKQRWDLSPGFESRTWHSGRRIVDGCVQCHFGPVEFTQDRQADSYPKPTFLEENIGCERCHGPGGEHVAWHQSLAENKKGTDPIAKISSLNARQREAVCYQCHLQGVERITRYGRDDFDFRPGHELSDVWLILTLGESSVKNGVTDAVSQVQQMRSSQCFIQSEGRLGCTSCHDPHGIPDAESRTEFYRQSCLNCHASGNSTCQKPENERRSITAEDSCIVCHMPALQTSDVPHTAQTDHRILRAPGEAAAGESKNVFSFFDDAQKRVPETATQRALGILMAQVAEREKDQLLAVEACQRLDSLADSHADDLLLLHHLGTAYQVQGKTYLAADYWRRCLDQNPKYEPSLMSLALLFHDQGDWSQAIPYFKKVLAFNEWNRDASGRYIHSLGRAGQLDVAFEFAQKAIERFPDDWQIHAWLAEAYRVRVDEANAKLHAKLSEQLKDSP